MRSNAIYARTRTNIYALVSPIPLHRLRGRSNACWTTLDEVDRHCGVREDLELILRKTRRNALRFEASRVHVARKPSEFANFPMVPVRSRNFVDISTVARSRSRATEHLSKKMQCIGIPRCLSNLPNRTEHTNDVLILPLMLTMTSLADRRSDPTPNESVSGSD